jgi:hypothetical protein
VFDAGRAAENALGGLFWRAAGTYSPLVGAAMGIYEFFAAAESHVEAGRRVFNGSGSTMDYVNFWAGSLGVPLSAGTVTKAVWWHPSI